MNSQSDTGQKTALITGGARRVGRTIAKRLASLGTNIVIHYNTSRDEAQNLASEISNDTNSVRCAQADLADPQSIHGMAEDLSNSAIEIDILINSAAVYFPTPLGEVDVETWDQIHHINLRAPFLLAQAFGPLMKQRGYGRIINIADCNTRRPYRHFTPYLASKAGIVTLTESLALELAPTVTVNAISPGTVLPPDDSDAEYRQAAINRSPLKRSGTPEDIADMVAYLVENGGFITGANFLIDGGATIR